MPTAREPQRTSLTPLVLVITAAATLAAVWFHLPAALVAAIGISISAWMHAPQVPQRGEEPTPKAQAATRRWRELRWRSLVPNADWLMRPTSELDDFRAQAKSMVKLSVAGDVMGVIAWLLLPTRFVSVIALAAAAAALTLPTDGSLLLFKFPLEFVWVNALYAYVCVTAVDNVIRRTITAYDPSPGVSFTPLVDGLREKDGGSWRSLIGFVLLGAAVAVAVGLTLVTIDFSLPLGFLYLIVPWPLLVAALGLVVTAACLHGVTREAALEPWRDTVATRAAWVTRWEGLKQNDVHMLSHEKVGPGIVDTFDAPATLGSAGAIALYTKVLPFLGAGVEAAMLTVPNTDSQGQPVPGSAHPGRFRVVTWPSDADVDVNDPETDEAVVSLRLETAVFLAANARRYDPPFLLGLTALHAPGTTPAAWGSQWTSPVPESAIALSVIGAQGFADGAELFFGEFDRATLTDKSLLGRRERLEVIDRWAQRWNDTLKKDAKKPVLQYEHKKTARYDNQVTLNFQPFLYPQGLSLQSYFEPYITNGLSSTLKAAPFVNVTGLTGSYMPGGDPGDRFPQGFAVIWSDKPVPSSPALVQQSASRDASKWILAGALNHAFDAAKLNRPELVEAQCLTSRASSGNVWRLSVRLHDGVTAAVVKSKIAVLKQTMGGVPWLRVTEWKYGVEIFAGAVPRGDGVKFTNPSLLARCDELDWEQAFLDLGLTAADGSAPRMTTSAPLESNPKVTRIEFTLPSPLSMVKVRENIAKLRAATGNEYVDIRVGTDASHFVILFCEENPMPFPAFLNWEQMLDTSGKEATRLPFASGIDGSSIVYDWTVDPHLNVLGASGGGKSFLIQILLAAAIARGCDILMVDPVKGGQDFVFAQPWLMGNIEQDDFIGAGEALEAIYQEVGRRKTLRNEYKVGKYSDLPEEVRPRHLFVVIDEFQSLLKAAVKLPKEPEDTDEATVRRFEESKLINAGIAKLSDAIGRIAREARSDGVTLVLAGQAMKADDLQKAGLGGLKVNFSRIAVGRMSWGELSSAFKDARELPDLGNIVPPGRGLYESNAVEGRAVQVWFEKGGQDEMRRRLLEVRGPIDPAQILDLDAMKNRVRARAPRAFGQIIDGDDDEIIEVGLSELGLDFGSFDFGSFEETPALGEDADQPAPDDEQPETIEETYEQDEPADSDAYEPEDASDTLFGDDFFTQDVPVAAAPAELNYIPELLEPPLGGPIETNSVPEEEPVNVEGIEPLFELTVEPIAGLVRVSDTPGSGALVFGLDIPIPASTPLTGWGKAEALANLIAQHPHISDVVWVGDDLLDEDDIGIPHLSVVEEMLRRAGIGFEHQATEAPQKLVPEPDPEEELPAPPAPKPVRAEMPAERPTPEVTAAPKTPAPKPSADDDWFAAPKQKTKPVIPEIDF